MDGENPIDAVENDAAHASAQFLDALFDDRDVVLFRPIETWVEGGKKQSRVVCSKTLYRQNLPTIRPFTLRKLLSASATERANIFFGVCPRFGPDGHFDQAWQIRSVTALWADIDHVSVDDAIAKGTAAGMPPPSIVVNSGNGVHLYWLLDEPYLIDDVGDPPPVLTEWSETPGGRKARRDFILEGGERIYLDRRQHVSRLSPKAQHAQHVLAGIATAIGGDHTTDLPRLLRLPGTLNRKDERNDKAPVPCTLVECDPTRRYAFSTFASFAEQAPDRNREQRLAAMPLPKPRKVSLAKADRLADLVAACAVALLGQRSEADFSLCCYAVRNGVGKDHVWEQVENVGKFAEAGVAYFERTWDNAEYEVRAGKLQKIEKQSAPIVSNAAPGNVSEVSESADGSGGVFDHPVIRVDPAIMPVGLLMEDITNQLLGAKNCYVRSGQLVVIRSGAIGPILKASELAGLLNDHVEFYFVKDEGGEYKPLPAQYGNAWLHHPGERDRLPAIRLFSQNPVYADDWRLVAPGFDKESGIYFAGAAVEPRGETNCLDALLQDFCFKAVADRTNYLGMLLTPLMMPRFIGSKPAALFNGNQPALGKSILAQIIAILRDGRPAETATYNPNDEEFEKRLGAIVRSGATTIIIDNAKHRGRRPMESACLERSLTDAVLSFRLLGYSDSIRTENSHIFCITANMPDVGRDLVTRSVAINLEHEGNPARRSFSIQDPEGYALEHRAELLGELVGMVERWKAVGMPLADLPSRFNKRGWANITGGILAACGEPDFLANADDAAAQLDESRREFSELVELLAEHPQGTWTAAELAEQASKHGLLQVDRGEGSLRSQSTRMGILASRFVAERFELSGDRCAVFHKSSDRKGAVYRIEIPPLAPNVEGFAELGANVDENRGSAA